MTRRILVGYQLGPPWWGAEPEQVELVIYSTKGAGRDGEGLAWLLVR